jgi:hypothetical protein
MKTITYDETKWQLVPKIPTDEMEEACPYGMEYSKNTANFKAMLAAAPCPKEAKPVANIAGEPSKDTERLDFISRQELQVWEINGRYYVRDVIEAIPISDKYYDYGSAREAIDAAIATMREPT